MHDVPRHLVKRAQVPGLTVDQDAAAGVPAPDTSITRQRLIPYHPDTFARDMRYINLFLSGYFVDCATGRPNLGCGNDRHRQCLST